ncbi:elongin-B-like [Babylonia areolata]|uniref:elongin-B-like n=1 Tax=Babylonia areolata TaxID=304850 RepID=UPI003FD45AB6
MDVFLMIRRMKTTIFTDAKETTSLIDVKRIVEGITKVPPENQRLFREDQALTDDNKCLGDYGLNTNNAKAQSPATLGLTYKKEDGEWEQLDIQPLSSPPELPDVMKPQETSQQVEQAAA